MTTTPSKSNVDDLISILTPKLSTPKFRLFSVQGMAWIVVRSLWRYFITGRPLTGEPRDNATFLHRATVDYRGKPKEKLTGPIWQRLTRRWVALGVPSLLLAFAAVAWVVAAVHTFLGAPAPGWTQIAWVSLTIGYVVLGTVIVTGTFGWKVKKALPDRAAKKEFALPTAEVIANTMGIKATKRELASMVTLPTGYDRKQVDEPVRVALRPGTPVSEGMKKQILAQAASTLGIRNPIAEFHLTGSQPYFEIRPNPGPPNVVTWNDVLPFVEKADVTKPVLGLGHGGKPVYADFTNDSPHLGISGGTGTGKSTLMQFLLAQRLHHGTALIVLDYKGVSHRWARELPSHQVRYVHQIEDIHELCVRLGEEVHARIEAAVADESASDGFRTLDVLCEEINSLTPKLNTWWAENREPGDPKKSPAVTALAELVNMGREFKMHAHFAAQRLSAAALGGQGGDIRESLQIRLLAKWTKATWKMLCDGVPYVAFPGGPRGIWAAVIGDEVSIIRVPKIDRDVVVDWARTAEPHGAPMFYSGAPSVRTASAPRVIDGAVVQEPVQQLVTLTEALKILPAAPDGTKIGKDALRTASKRPGFPSAVGAVRTGVAAKYDAEALIEWKSARDAGKEWAAGAPRPGAVYGFNTECVGDDGARAGGEELGYIGQTRRGVATRAAEHLGTDGVGEREQPWSDLVVGEPFVIWEGICTDAELDERELAEIRARKPRYNWQGQDFMEHVIPPATAAEHRALRGS